MVRASPWMAAKWANMQERRIARCSVQNSGPSTHVSSAPHEALRLWLRLLATTNRIEARVRAALQTQFSTTLPRFDLMAQLDRFPNGLKMGELSKRLLVTRGNVTGITDGLERAGMVVRDADPSDRRAYRVKLTASGRKAFRAMAAEHEGWIIQMFSGVTAQDMVQLKNLLGKITEQNTLKLENGK